MLAWLSLDAIWSWLTSWANLSMFVGFAAVAAAVFSENIIIKFAIPDLRRNAITVAVIAFSITTIYTKGYSDGLTVKQAEWDSGLVKEANQATSDRADAVRTVGPMPTDRSLFRSDPFNRNRDGAAVICTTQSGN